MELVNQWLGVAKQLGDLEEERARLSQPSSSGAAEVNNARIGWVRVANALLANAELVGLDDDTDRPTFWGAFFTRRFAKPSRACSRRATTGRAGQTQKAIEIYPVVRAFAKGFRDRGCLRKMPEPFAPDRAHQDRGNRQEDLGCDAPADRGAAATPCAAASNPGSTERRRLGELSTATSAGTRWGRPCLVIRPALSSPPRAPGA